MKKILLFYFILLFAVVAALILYKPHAAPYVSREEPAMGTFVKITMERREDCEKLLNESFCRIKELEKTFSVHDSESEISRLNKLKKAEVSDELLFLIRKSIEISRATEGAFDITALPIINLYRNAEKKGIPPSENQIKETIKRIGWQKIEILGSDVKIPCEIDMGGIAKGYIVDKTAEFLKAQGIRSALINAGGDIYCFGENPGGRKWSIGIQDPFVRSGVKRIVHVTGYGIVTSGDYERYMTIKGKKYGHIVNPLTGKSVQNFPAGVTVIASNAATADGFATAFYVLGVKKSIEIAEREKNMEVLIIDGDGKIYESRKFSNFAAP